MHKALREVLGAHVQQKGSLVDPDKTRFDFAHHAPMTDDEIRRVESLVNAEILDNHPTNARVMAMEEAQKLGAVMLFGEKYGDSVRVLDIGSSRELCGGTHVARTGDIGLFKITDEGGVAAGIRRVEAVTGKGALAYVQAREALLNGAAAALKSPVAEIEARIAQLVAEARATERELARVKAKAAASAGDDLAGNAVDVKGSKVVAATIEGADVKALRDTMDKLKDKLKSAAIVLSSIADGKVTLIAGVTSDLTGRRQGRRARQPCCAAGRRQGRRAAGHGAGRRHQSSRAADGAAVGSRLGRAAAVGRAIVKPIQFASDNNAGICPEAMAALQEANRGHVFAYGRDAWTERAKDAIRRVFDADAEVFLVFSGTAANALGLSAICRNTDAVICHAFAHVNVDECGAHRVLQRRREAPRRRHAACEGDARSGGRARGDAA